MEENCLWCRVISIAGAMVFITRSLFIIRKTQICEGPECEHALRHADRKNGKAKGPEENIFHRAEMVALTV